MNSKILNFDVKFLISNKNCDDKKFNIFSQSWSLKILVIVRGIFWLLFKNKGKIHKKDGNFQDQRLILTQKSQSKDVKSSQNMHFLKLPSLYL